MTEPVEGLDKVINHIFNINFCSRWRGPNNAIAGCCGAYWGIPASRAAIKGVSLFITSTPDKIDLGFSLEKDKYSYWINYEVFPFQGNYLHVISKSCEVSHYTPSEQFANATNRIKEFTPLPKGVELYNCIIVNFITYFGDGKAVGVYDSLGVLKEKEQCRLQPSQEVYDYCCEKVLELMKGKELIFIRKDLKEGDTTNYFFDTFLAKYIKHSSAKFFNVPYYEHYKTNYLQLHVVKVE